MVRTANGNRGTRRRLGAVSAVGAAAVLALGTLGGCSVSVGGDDLDTGELEESIADGLMDEGVDAEVSCPDDIEAEEGGEFTCTATAPDGTTATVAVTQTNDDGDVRWRVLPN